MKRRRYQGEADGALLQAFNTAAIARSEGCRYDQPGEFPHQRFNGNKLLDPAELRIIWADEQGVAAWVLVGSRHRSCAAQMRPDLRGTGSARGVPEYAEHHTLDLTRRHGIDANRLSSTHYRGDTPGAELLTASG